MKKTLGRQKILIKKLEKKSQLQVTFSKRRAGLFKKAAELSVLCGAEIAVLVFSPTAKIYTFGHPSVESLFDGFLTRNFAPPKPAEAFLPLPELNGDARNNGRRFWWDEPLASMKIDKLKRFRSSLLELRRNVSDRVDELTAVRNRGLLMPVSPSFDLAGNVEYQSLPSFDLPGDLEYQSPPSFDLSGNLEYQSPPSFDLAGDLEYLPSFDLDGDLEYQSLPSFDLDGDLEYQSPPSFAGDLEYQSPPSFDLAGDLEFQSLPSFDLDGNLEYQSLPSFYLAGDLEFQSLPSFDLDGDLEFQSLPSFYLDGEY